MGGRMNIPWMCGSVGFSKPVLPLPAGVLCVRPDLDALLSPALLFLQDPVPALFQGFASGVPHPVALGFVADLVLSGIFHLVAGAEGAGHLLDPSSHQDEKELFSLGGVRVIH